MDREQLTQTIEQYYQSQLTRYLDVLGQMVSINSHTYNPAGVNRLGDFTAVLFGELGFEAEYVQAGSPEHGTHLFLRHPAEQANRDTPMIALISHLDTVFSEEEEKQNDFIWRQDGKRIYGPGTVDIKGGTLMIYMLLEALRRFQPEIFTTTNWLVAMDAAEEVLSEGFGDLCLERLTSNTRACLVFEGGTISDQGFPIVVGRKGLANFRVQVEGRSAHSGNAHSGGANALVQLAYTIQKIAGFTDYAQEITFNVGLANGGSATNRVPHYAEAVVEMRAYKPDIFEAGMTRMYALEKDSQVSSADGFPCSITVKLERRTPPWPINRASERLFAFWQQAGKQFGLTAIPEQRGGLSDGNHLWEHYPTIDGLGPSGGNAHCSERSEDGSKDQEYILVNSIVPKATLNFLAVMELLSSNSVDVSSN